jgi:hypothetical protein
LSSYRFGCYRGNYDALTPRFQFFRSRKNAVY